MKRSGIKLLLGKMRLMAPGLEQKYLPKPLFLPLERLIMLIFLQDCHLLPLIIQDTFR